MTPRASRLDRAEARRRDADATQTPAAGAHTRPQLWHGLIKGVEHLESAPGSANAVHRDSRSRQRFDVAQHRTFGHLETLRQVASREPTPVLQQQEQCEQSSRAHRQSHQLVEFMPYGVMKALPYSLDEAPRAAQRE